MKAQWLQPQIQQWVRGVEQLAQVAPHFPQMAYTGLTKSLQLEWQYIQRVIPAIGTTLAPIEEALANTFLPALLDKPPASTTRLRMISTLLVQYAGLGIPNPTATAAQNYAASRELMDPLTSSIATGTELGIHAYSKACAGARKMQQKRKESAATTLLKRICTTARPADARQMT